MKRYSYSPEGMVEDTQGTWLMAQELPMHDLKVSEDVLRPIRNRFDHVCQMVQMEIEHVSPLDASAAKYTLAVALNNLKDVIHPKEYKS